MTGAAPRGRIADRAPDGTPYGHLLPVVEAEREWGNETRDGFRPQHDTWVSAHFRDALHVERLRAEFDFPPHIRVGRGSDGLTFVSDDEALVSLVGFARSPGRTGPPRPPRTGLLARVLGR